MYLLDNPNCEKSQRFLTVMAGSGLNKAKLKLLHNLPESVPENAIIDRDPLNLSSFDIAGNIAPFLSAERRIDTEPDPKNPNKFIQVDKGEVWRFNLAAAMGGRDTLY
jgi:hypothetical protein